MLFGYFSFLTHFPSSFFSYLFFTALHATLKAVSSSSYSSLAELNASLKISVLFQVLG